MTDCCIHTSEIARRQHLWSAGCHQLFVPRHRRSMFGCRACSVTGLTAWNSLPDYRRDPSRSFDSFRRDLKTSFFFLFFRFCQRTQRIRGFAIMRYTNLLLTLTLTLTAALCPLHRTTCVMPAPPVKNRRSLSGQSWTARMPSLTATSAFGLGRRLIAASRTISVHASSVFQFLPWPVFGLMRHSVLERRQLTGHVMLRPRLRRCSCCQPTAHCSKSRHLH